MGVAARMQAARLAVIVDPSEFGLTNLDRRDANLGPLAQGLFGAGADLIQLQTSAELPDAELAEAIELVRAVSYDYQGLVSVGDAVEVASATSIDVFHLERSTLSAQTAAASQHEWALVGRSCRSREEVDAAIADADVDYFFVAPELVSYAAKAAPVSAADAKPWFASGGATLDNLDEVLANGARRVCIAAYGADGAGSASDPVVVAEEFTRRLREVWRSDPEVPELGGSPSPNAQPRFRRPGDSTG